MKEINIEEIDLNYIRTFVAIYEEKSATRAAIRLNLTQSAVSAQLANMRNLYQDPLFMRTGRGLKPTTFATQLYGPLKECVDRFKESFEMHSGKIGLYNGRTITIGLSDDFEIALGPDLMKLAKQVPNCTRLFFKQTNKYFSEEMLHSRQIDLAITGGGGRQSEDLVSQLIGVGNYGCLIDPEFFDKNELNIDDYVSREHILVSNGGFFGVVDEALAAIGRKRTVRVSTSHFAAIPFLLKGTECVTTIPKHAAKSIARVSRLKYFDCPLNLPSYNVNLTWRFGSRKDKVVQDLIKIFSTNLCL